MSALQMAPNLGTGLIPGQSELVRPLDLWRPLVGFAVSTLAMTLTLALVAAA